MEFHCSHTYYFGNLSCFGFSNYDITEDGYVISLKSEIVLLPFVDRRGYANYSLWKDDGTRLTVRAHQLVAKLYVPNPHNHIQVNHIDGNKLNNHYSNLEWVSNLENAHKAMAAGLWTHHVFTDSQVEEVCRRLQDGETQSSIARTMNVPRSAVAAIKLRRNWKHISANYNF